MKNTVFCVMWFKVEIKKIWKSSNIRLLEMIVLSDLKYEKHFFEFL